MFGTIGRHGKTVGMKKHGRVRTSNLVPDVVVVAVCDTAVGVTVVVVVVFLET